MCQYPVLPCQVGGSELLAPGAEGCQAGSSAGSCLLCLRHGTGGKEKQQL